MKFLRKVSLYLQCLIILVRPFTTQAEWSETEMDIQDTMLSILPKIPEECAAVVLFDVNIPEFILDNLLQGLHLEGRVILTLDLSCEQLHRFNTTEESEIVKKYLSYLYREWKCYVFLVWLKHLSVLYPESTTNMHPGWRKQDFVLLRMSEVTDSYFKKVTALKLWKVIPNVIGLRKRDTKSNRVIIFTVIPFYIKGQEKSQQLDIWSVKQKQFERNLNLFADKFTNFNQSNLRIGIITWKQPYLIPGNKENPYLDGIDWRLLGITRNKLNYKIGTRATSSLSGTRLENGSWTGILGYLVDGEIDIAIGGIIISPERLKYFDFCRPYYTDAYTFVSPLMTQSPSVWNALTKPLSFQVWLSLGGTAILVIYSLKYIALMMQRIQMNQPGEIKFEDQLFTRLTTNIGFMFCAFCQKPFTYVPKSAPLKMAFLGVYLSLIILGIIFGGRMFSLILFKSSDVSIDRIEDMEKSILQINLRDYDGYLNEHLKLMHSSLWKNLQLIDQMFTLDSMDEVVHGKQMYIDARSVVDFLAEYNYKGAVGYKFHVSSEDIVQGRIAWAIRKNWPFRETFDKLIMHTVESGLINYWMKRFKRGNFAWDDEAWNLAKHMEVSTLPDRERRTVEFDPTLSLKRKDIKLEFDDFLGVGVIWMTGLVVAVVVFIIELVLGRLVIMKSLAMKKKCATDKKDVYKTFKKVKEVPIISKDLQKQLNNSLDSEVVMSIVWADFNTTKSLKCRGRSLVLKN